MSIVVEREKAIDSNGRSYVRYLQPFRCGFLPRKRLHQYRSE